MSEKLLKMLSSAGDPWQSDKELKKLIENVSDKCAICEIYKKTSKFEWMPNNTRIEKISRFLEYHWLHFVIKSRSCNHSMLKKRKQWGYR